jgi:transcriptional regulator GlxA family with amidase domain
MKKGFFILEVERIVEENMQITSLSGAFIAEQLGISRMHLHRKLMEYLGLSARDYIKEKRIKQAQALLTKSNQPIQSVARQTGFSSIAYFSKVFKKTVGIPPSEFKL